MPERFNIPYATSAEPRCRKYSIPSRTTTGKGTQNKRIIRGNATPFKYFAPKKTNPPASQKHKKASVVTARESGTSGAQPFFIATRYPPKSSAPIANGSNAIRGLGFVSETGPRFVHIKYALTNGINNMCEYNSECPANLTR